MEVRYLNRRKRDEALHREQVERGSSAKPIRRWVKDGI